MAQIADRWNVSAYIIEGIIDSAIPQATAGRAKVSTATVSRVINNIDVVRPATRQRVEKAMQELHYRPNPHARTLGGGKSPTIGMIASNLENPFVFDIFQTLEEDAQANGYEVVVANTGYHS